MPKTIHSSTFIYDFCYCGEENLSSCDSVPSAVNSIFRCKRPKRAVGASVKMQHEPAAEADRPRSRVHAAFLHEQ